MSIRKNILGHRPDGEHGRSGRWTWAVRTDNCANRFSKISAEKSFLIKDIVRTVARPLQVISL